MLGPLSGYYGNNETNNSAARGTSCSCKLRTGQQRRQLIFSHFTIRYRAAATDHDFPHLKKKFVKRRYLFSRGRRVRLDGLRQNGLCSLARSPKEGEERHYLDANLVEAFCKNEAKRPRKRDGFLGEIKLALSRLKPIFPSHHVNDNFCTKF